MNSMGNCFRITSFGESHGQVIGIIVDGCPSGLKIDVDFIQNELNRRRPGQSNISTTRKEMDQVKILSGVVNGISTGAPICMIIENTDADSSKYEEYKIKPRPSHADFPALMRFGDSVDLRGSGRFSGRNTAGFVMAGAIAKIILRELKIEIGAYTRSINTIKDEKEYNVKEIKESIEKNSIRTVQQDIAKKMQEKIESVKNQGDSVGGVITCIIEGIPAGIGEPMFDSIESLIASAMFSIPAVKGIEFGAGFKATQMLGSQHNDPYIVNNGKIETSSNNAGGIIGGISTGMPIQFNIAIKPTASIGIEQNTVDLSEMKKTTIKVEGRHDPCIVPRAIPVVETMAAIVIVDLLICSGKIPKIIK